MSEEKPGSSPHRQFQRGIWCSIHLAEFGYIKWLLKRLPICFPRSSSCELPIASREGTQLKPSAVTLQHMPLITDEAHSVQYSVPNQHANLLPLHFLCSLFFLSFLLWPRISRMSFNCHRALREHDCSSSRFMRRKSEGLG